MSQGIPLTDEDRWPWLQAIAELVAVRNHEGKSTVVTCSALKRAYRDVLRDAAPTLFVHLEAPFAVLEKRMSQRTKHFMPTALLQSQFDTLEPLGGRRGRGGRRRLRAAGRGHRGGRQRRAHPLHGLSR